MKATKATSGLNIFLRLNVIFFDFEKTPVRYCVFPNAINAFL